MFYKILFLEGSSKHRAENPDDQNAKSKRDLLGNSERSSWPAAIGFMRS
jgi:hypothetical protein